MLFHVLAHVEAQKRHAERLGELFRQLRLADAGRTGKEERASRFADAGESGTRALHRTCNALDRPVLAEDDSLEVRFEAPQSICVLCDRGFDWNPGDSRYDALDVAHADGPPLLARRPQPNRCPRLIHHIDRLVGQEAIVHVANRKVYTGFECRAGKMNPVVGFVARGQALQNAHALLCRGLLDIDLLEAARQRPIAFEMSILLVRRRAHASQSPVGQPRLQQIRRIDRRPLRGARTQNRMNLVDEEDEALALL